MNRIVQAESVGKTFQTRSGELSVLRDVTLTMNSGESLVIMGPSGSGKSTLLNILGTLEEPTAGSVMIDGCDPFALPQHSLARFRNTRIGFVFQEHHLLPQLTVLENVLLPTLAGHRKSDGDAVPLQGNAAPLQGVARARVLLDRVELLNRLDHRPGELSGGQRQRVALARAMINKPVLLLADEPTGNLDRSSADNVADLLLEVHRDENATLIVVTHNDTLAKRFSLRRDLIDGTLSPP